MDNTEFYIFHCVCCVLLYPAEWPGAEQFGKSW